MAKDDDETHFRRDMQILRVRYQGGNLTAFAQAVRLCWLYQEHPPRWVMEASEVLVERAMAEDEKRARREFIIHRTRWETLAELRERRHELAASGDERGTSWERAREAVSEYLQNDEAAGSAATIKDSYELIQDAGGEQATFKSFLEARQRRQARRRRESKPG
jgi:hypothetical protein